MTQHATPSTDAASHPNTEPAADTVLAQRAEQRRHARALFARFAECAADDPRRAGLRDELVALHMPIVEYVARRFYGRGEPLSDLVQVASIGLLNAVDRFDLGRGLEFTSYATPTIVGEIKRYFRDKGWMVRVPRRLQELRGAMTGATSELNQQLGRPPTIAELATRLDAREDEIVEALDAGNAYAPMSIEAQTDPETGWSLGDSLGSADAAFERVEYRESLRPLLAELDERERTILMLRFFENKTQSQIAEQIGLSQMHVSRLLARTLTQLREKLAAD